MKYLLLLLFVPVFVSSSQNEFPESWIGTYSGNMLIANPNVALDTAEIEFEFIELIKDSAWTYKMTFHSKKYGNIVKDYVIRSESEGDKENLILDELNGIYMEMTLLNGTLYGMYEVMGYMYIVSMRKIGDDLLYDLFGGPMEDPLVSSAKEGDQEIEALSHKPNVAQSALLKRDN
jgi:hypothetical protein